jgi:hypothetical protein
MFTNSTNMHSVPAETLRVGPLFDDGQIMTETKS